MAINSINLFNVYAQNSIPQVPQAFGQNQNGNPSLIGLNQNQPQGDTFTKSQQEQEQNKTPSGKTVSKEDKDKMLKRQDEVKRHEQAHQAAGGSLASAPSYEYNEYGYIQNGHVDIDVPEVNEKNPESSKSKAETVKRSALAPSGFSELSSADLSVASKAESVIKESERLMSERKSRSQGQPQGQEPQASLNPFA